MSHRLRDQNKNKEEEIHPQRVRESRHGRLGGKVRDKGWKV